MRAAPRPAIDELRKALAAVAPAPSSAPLPTGCLPLDAALGGGLPRGRLVEVAGPWSSGKTTLVLAAAARITARHLLCAWVDARAELYPPSAAALGVDLARLLVVRPPARGAARAGEIVARSGAFPLVVLDLADGEAVDEAAAGRLRAAASAGQTAVVALAVRAGALAQATVKLEVAGRAVTVGKGGAAPPGTRVAWGFAPAVESEPMGLVLRRRKP